MDQIKLLKEFLEKNSDSISNKDKSLIEKYIKLLEKCDHNIHSQLLKVENDEKIKDKLVDDIENLKGIANV